jgi:hypothetical protein
MKRIIIHWTAGSYIASSLDRQHYHRLIQGDGSVIDGHYPISANRNTSDRDYAAHTRGLNTDSIGVALCAMAGATESPFREGAYPIKKAQWAALFEVLRDLCEQYNLLPSERTVLTHAEVERVFAIKQSGKWDIRVTPGGSLVTAKEVGDLIRKQVVALLDTKPADPKPLSIADLPVIRGYGTAATALQRALGVTPDGIIGPQTYRALLTKVRI